MQGQIKMNCSHSVGKIKLKNKNKAIFFFFAMLLDSKLKQYVKEVQFFNGQFYRCHFFSLKC